MDSNIKRYRPLGMTLGLIAAFIVFILLPAIEAFFLISFTSLRIQDAGGGLSGVRIGEYVTNSAFLQLALIGVYVIVFLAAWRGWPAWVRVIFPVFTLLRALPLVWGWVERMLNPTFVGVDSAEQLTSIAAYLVPAMALLIALYNLWFFNRWSVKAYFRRNYTPEDIQRLHEMGLLPAREAHQSAAGTKAD